MEFSFWVPRNREDTYRLIASLDGMECFRGGGLVPGIQSARVLPDKTIFVQDSWGLYHREWVVQARPPESLVFYIQPNPLLQIFVRSLSGLSEEWELQESNGGTLVHRSFSWDRRLPVPQKSFKRAIDRNSLDLQKFIASTKRPRRPLHAHQMLQRRSARGSRR